MSRSSSAVVDSKVVEMSFENSNFERNAATSLSTLQKLKEALNFGTSSKDGFDKLGDSVKKVNFNPLNEGVRTLKIGIDSLADTIGFAAIVRYTNQALAAVERLTKAMTVDQVSAGWQKYADKTTSVATLVAQGYELEKVNDQLDRLNWFTDETSYNFTEMVANIAKFTATGQDLDSSVTAMEGIATWAALSGQNARTASAAMYQLSQAMGAGVMRKEDYKSIQNASMDTDEFRQKALDAAVALGTLKKTGEDTYQSLVAETKAGKEEFSKAQFAESLTQGLWFNKDVMMKVFNDYSAAVDQIYEYAEERGITASEAMAEAGDMFDEFGVKAFKAAQEARSWADVVDSVKDAVSTGFMNMFEIIFGDYEQATALWTSMANGLYDIIVEPINSLNEILGDAFGTATKVVDLDEWNKLGLSEAQATGLAKALKEVAEASGVAFEEGDLDGFLSSLDDGWLKADKLKEVLKDFGEGTSALEDSTKTLEEFHEAVMKVIRGGDTGYSSNMEERFKQLTEDGFDPQQVQDYVNEVHKLAGGTWDLTDAIIAEADANLNLEGSLAAKTDEELLALGYTQDEIDELRELQKVAEETGKPLNELLNADAGMTGREKLLENLKTGLSAIGRICSQVRKAFTMIFPPLTAQSITNIIDKIGALTSAFDRFAKRNQHKIRNIFLGIFSAVDLVGRTISSLAGGAMRLLQKAFSNVGIMKFLSQLGLMIKGFRDWVVENEIIEKSVAKIESVITSAASAVSKWIDSFINLPNVQAVIEKFSDAFKYIRDNFPQIMEKAKNSLSEFGTSVVESFKYSKTPREFFEGVKEAFNKLWTDISGSTVYQKIEEAFKQLGTSIKEFFIDLGNNADGSRNTFGKIIDAFAKFKVRMSNLLRGLDENGNKIDPFDGIRIAFENLLADLSASGIKEKIENALGIVWTTINDFFMTFGTNADGTLNTFGKVWTGLVEGFTWIRDKALAAKNALVQFFTEHKLGKFFADSFNDISTGVVAFFTGIPKFVDGAVEKFKDFFSGVKDLGGFKFENLGKIWELFKATLGKYFTGSDLFEPIVTAFSNIKDRVVEKIAEFGINLGEIKDKIVGFVDDIKTAFSNFSLPGVFEAIVDFFVGAKDKVVDGAESAGNGIVGFFDNVRNRILSINIGTIKKIIAAFLLFKTLMFIKSLVKPVEQLISAMAAEKKAHANFLNKAALLETAAAIGIFALVIAGLSKLNVGEIAKGIISIGLMLTLLGLFGILTSKFGDAKSMAAVGTMALELSFSVILLSIAVKLIGELLQSDPGSMVAGVIGLVALFVALGIVAKKMSDLNGLGAMMSGGAVLEVIGALYGTLLLIRIIAGMDIGTLIKGALEVLALAGVLALVMAAMKKAVGDGGLSISIGIAGLAACILAIAGAMWIMSTIDIPSMIASAIALGVLMGVLTKVLQSAAEFKSGTGAMIGLAAVIVSLALSIGILSLIEPTALIGPTIAMGALIALLALIAKMASGLGPATAAIFGLALLVGVIGTVLLLLTTMTDPSAVLPVAGGILLVAIAISAVLGVCAAVGSVAPAALTGIGLMTLCIGAFIGLAALAVFLTGALSGSFAKLPQIADDIAGFMKNLSKLNDIGTVDVAPLAEALGAIAGISVVGFADSLLSIATEIQSGKTAAQTVADDMSAVAEGFGKFAEAMDKYGDITIDTTGLDAIVDTIGEISLQGFFTSLGNLLLGEDQISQVDQFATDMGTLASALSAWQTEMEPLAEINVPTDAIAKIKEALDSIKEGGIIDSVLNFFGVDTTPDYTSFSEGVKGLGKAINDFSNSLGENFDEAKLTTAIDAIKKLSEVGVALGDVDFGGWFHDGVLTTFANELVEMVPNLNQFVDSFSNLESFTKVATAVSKISSSVSTLSTIKFGKSDLMNTEMISQIKQNIDSVIQIFSNIQTADISAVNRFSSALTKLNNINLAEAAKKVSAAASTKESGKETGKQLSESIASGVDSSIIARALTKAVKAAVSGIDTSKYTTLGKNLGTQVSKGIQRASDTLKESAKTIGTNFTTALANAIRSTTSKVTTASGNMAKSAATTANNYRSQFQTAGSNFSAGLANGILANRSAAINAAATVAAEALRAAKEKLDMHSPSRETEKVGKFFDLGFARGISRFGSTVLSESVGVADIAMKGLQRAVDLAADMAMGDGIGSPVITPILDLSEIQNGASEIGSILGSSRPDVTLGNLRAISFNADALRQQRTSNDLLTAIQTLGSDLSNSPSGDTYIVNGITYDDGSNVSDAVRSLIRAVKVERRA